MKIYKISNNLYQGGLPDDTLPSEIKAVVSLSSFYDIPLEYKIFLPIEDGVYPGDSWLNIAVDIVSTLMDNNITVLVHCQKAEVEV